MESIKYITAIVAVLVFSSESLFASNFDQEKLTTFSPGKKILAVYKNRPMIALTGDEVENFKSDRTQEVIEDRANQTCKIFGYKSGSASMYDIINPMDLYSRRGYVPEEWTTAIGLQRYISWPMLVELGKGGGHIAVDGNLTYSFNVVKKNLINDTFPRYFSYLNCIEK